MNWRPSMTAASMRPGVKRALQLLRMTIGVFLLCLPAWSQGNAGRILGTLTDQSGGVLVGATVTVTDTQRGTTRTLTTNQAGEYNGPGLLPSTYTVRAEAMGFKTIERVGILLEANQELRVDLVLQPGQQTQTITVTEALPMVDTTNAELGGTLQSDIIDSLPMNGRNFQNLLQLTPGVMIYPGGDFVFGKHERPAIPRKSLLSKRYLFQYPLGRPERHEFVPARGRCRNHPAGGRHR